MNYIVGLIIATLALALALDHLGQGPENYWDLVAFAIVWGGTFAVSIVTMPWAKYKVIFKTFGKLIFYVPPSRRKFVELCLQQISRVKYGDTPVELKSGYFHEQVLNDGFELIRLGVTTEKIQNILQERIHFYARETGQIADSIRNLSKYPPAFGLTGTVFGLVELMKGVSAGIPAKETGVKMAIALVATMYGLLVANLIINPAGEHVKKIARGEEEMAEVALQAVLLASQSVSLLESQEMMNSMLPLDQKVDIISQSLGEAA